MKHINKIVVIAAASFCVTQAFGAAPTTTKSGISASRAYSIKLIKSNATIVADNGKVVADPSLKEADNAQWSLVPFKETGEFFMFNVKENKFVATDGKTTSLSDRASLVKLDFSEKVGGWTISCNGDCIGLPADSASVILTPSLNSGHNIATFVITPQSSLSSDQKNAIAEIATADAIKAGIIADMKDFAAKAEAMSSKTQFAGYAGGYDLTALKAAVADPSQYSVADLRGVMNDVIESGLPQPFHYYRIHNASRPNNSIKSNVLHLVDGSVASIDNVGSVTIGSGGRRIDNLALFTVDPLVEGGDMVVIRSAALDLGMSDSYANSPVTFVADPHQYLLAREDKFGYLFRFRNSLAKLWITSNPSGSPVSYGISEPSMDWGFELIESVGGIKLNEFGEGSVCLPCPVELPENVTAFVASTTDHASVYLKEIGRIVPAYTPVILKSKNKAAATISVNILNGQDLIYAADNHLSGNTAKISGKTVAFFPQWGENGTLSFVRQTKSSIAAHAVTIADSMYDGDQITVADKPHSVGIDSVNGDSAFEADEDSDLYFDIQGRRISRPEKGIYINATKGRVSRR